MKINNLDMVKCGYVSLKDTKLIRSEKFNFTHTLHTHYTHTKASLLVAQQEV